MKEQEISHLGLGKKVQMRLMAVKKSRKRSGFVIYSYCKNSAFIAVERDAKF